MVKYAMIYHLLLTLFELVKKTLSCRKNISPQDQKVVVTFTITFGSGTDQTTQTVWCGDGALKSPHWKKVSCGDGALKSATSFFSKRRRLSD